MVSPTDRNQVGPVQPAHVQQTAAVPAKGEMPGGQKVTTWKDVNIFSNLLHQILKSISNAFGGSYGKNTAADRQTIKAQIKSLTDLTGSLDRHIKEKNPNAVYDSMTKIKVALGEMKGSSIFAQKDKQKILGELSKIEKKLESSLDKEVIIEARDEQNVAETVADAREAAKKGRQSADEAAKAFPRATPSAKAHGAEAGKQQLVESGVQTRDPQKFMKVVGAYVKTNWNKFSEHQQGDLNRLFDVYSQPGSRIDPKDLRQLAKIIDQAEPNAVVNLLKQLPHEDSGQKGRLVEIVREKANTKSSSKLPGLEEANKKFAAEVRGTAEAKEAKRAADANEDKAERGTAIDSLFSLLKQLGSGEIKTKRGKTLQESLGAWTGPNSTQNQALTKAVENIQHAVNNEQPVAKKDLETVIRLIKEGFRQHGETTQVDAAIKEIQDRLRFFK